VVLPAEEEDVMEGDERILRMSLKLRRSSSSGKMRTRSEDESVLFEQDDDDDETMTDDAGGSDLDESLRQLSER
jgi:hypothetical protein